MHSTCETSTSRWFKVPFSSPSWRSLNPLKGSLKHPKEVTLNHQAFNLLWLHPSHLLTGGFRPSLWIRGRICGKELLGFSRTDDVGENRMVLELRNRPFCRFGVWNFRLLLGILLGWSFLGCKKLGENYVGYIYPSPYDANTLKHQYWVGGWKDLKLKNCYMFIPFHP